MENKFLTTIAVSLLAAISAYAEQLPAGLPYIGHRQVNCQVNKSGHALDNGYIADENCTTIYVMPPLVGTAKITAFSDSSNLFYCDFINETQSTHLQDLKILSDYATKIRDLKKKQFDSLNGDLSRAEMAEIKQQITTMNELRTIIKESVDQTRPIIKEYNADFGGTVMVTLLNNWTELLEAYSGKNKGLDVQPLPLYSGHLTYDMKRMSEFGLALNENPVIRTRNSMLKAKYPDPRNKEDVNFNVDYEAEESSFNMSNSANIALDLSLLGICPYTQIESPLKMSATKSPVAFLTPNLTYFYPITSKSIYTVKINHQALGDAVRGLKSKGGGKVTTLELAQAMSDKKVIAFSDESKNDLMNKSSISEESKKEAKQMLIDYIAENVLSRVGKLVDVLQKSSDYQDKVNVEKVGVSCSRSGFFRRKSCNAYTYSVTEIRINWQKIAEVVEKSLNNSSGASVSSQSTYQFMGTIPFVPPEEIDKLKVEFADAAARKASEEAAAKANETKESEKKSENPTGDDNPAEAMGE